MAVQRSRKVISENKSLEQTGWGVACFVRGAKEAPKYTDYILPLNLATGLCDVIDDELNRIATCVGSFKDAFELVRYDRKGDRFFLPLVPDDAEQPVWTVFRKFSDNIGGTVISYMRAIAQENPRLQGVIDSVDCNASTHSERDLDEDHIPDLFQGISTKRQPEPGMEVYDPTCASGGLLVTYEIVIEESAEGKGRTIASLNLFNQKFKRETLAGSGSTALNPIKH